MPHANKAKSQYLSLIWPLKVRIKDHFVCGKFPSNVYHYQIMSLLYWVGKKWSGKAQFGHREIQPDGVFRNT